MTDTNIMLKALELAWVPRLVINNYSPKAK